MMLVLTTVEEISLPGAWVGAGFIRNAVWDALHGRPVEAAWNDIDVVYFASASPSAAHDGEYEERLRARAPEITWSVKNQARMHLRNGDRPYRDLADALAHWPETCTSIAARWRGGVIEVLAPCGVEDLVTMRVRPTPAFSTKLAEFHRRLSSKDWLERWPGVRVIV